MTANIDALVERAKRFATIRVEPWIDRLFDRLAERFEYFRPRNVDAYERTDGARENQRRERFIPVRMTDLAREATRDAIKDARDDVKEDCKKKINDFLKMSELRLSCDALLDAKALRDAFAPFDVESDARYDCGYSQEELEERRGAFFAAIANVLEKCNDLELERETLERILRSRYPGATPLESDFSDYRDENFHIYLRGVSWTTRRAPRWKTFGTNVAIHSWRASRVCIVGELKADADERSMRSSVDVKLFKDLSLEEVKIAGPNANSKLTPFDLAILILKIAIATAIFIVKLFTVALLCVFLYLVTSILRCVLGVMTRRDKRMHYRARILYKRALASGDAAIDSLVKASCEQDLKEFALGYLFALKRGDWSTEKEIKVDVEAWIQERFELEVDFESDDALRKLKDKGLLETRCDVEEDGTTITRYRVKSLDDALEKLDADWDAFFPYSNAAHMRAQNCS